MNCEIYRDAIEDFLEGELDRQTAARLNAHFYACADCATRLELLKREKEIYAHYLFAAEPPNDLWTKFQAKLENEKIQPRSVSPEGVPFWKTYSFGLKSLSASPMIAAALIVFGVGFGLLYFWTSEKSAENQYSARTEIKNGEPPPAEIGETRAANNFPPESKNVGEINAPKVAENKNNKKLPNARTVADFKLVAVRNKIVNKQAVFDREDRLPAETFWLSERARAQRLEFENLKIETARQIEKVELLLRTFRNAQASAAGEDETFDVAYEKGQARKLLEKNARLRQSGELFGMADELELLSRVEPYLLEIANLDEKPAPRKVADIKERVANQNIIASLQIY